MNLGFLDWLIIIWPLSLYPVVDSAKKVHVGYSVPAPRASASIQSLTAPQIASRYGYRTEIHQAVTRDGYILELHRINGRQNEPPRPKGNKVVFLMHGFVSSSAIWILAGPGKGLGCILSDAGYDVWMGNARGNRYSRKHISRSPKGSQFWKFSLHEIGISDLPAMIDYILAITNQPKLTYIGYSQGTTVFFILTSTLPSYNARFTAFFALSPMAYMGKMYSPILQSIAGFADHMDLLLNMVGHYDFTPGGEFWGQIASKVCKDNAFTHEMCNNAMFLMVGFDRDQVNRALLPLFMRHVPAGASAQQLVHYAQLIRSHEFRQYDYGLHGNLRKYRRKTPPDYDLRKITAPSYIFYSINDWLCNTKDAKKTYDKLSNKKGMFLVPYKYFNHLDYVIAKDVKELLYDKVVSLMKSL